MKVTGEVKSYRSTATEALVDAVGQIEQYLGHGEFDIYDVEAEMQYFVSGEVASVETTFSWRSV